MRTDDAVRLLNELFAEEVEAALRYLHLAVTIKGLDRLVVRRTLLDGVDETLQHARVVAEKVLELGGVPGLDLNVHLTAEKTNAENAIRTALDFEQAALDAYRELLEKVAGNVELEEFAKTQIALESRHVAELQLLLED